MKIFKIIADGDYEFGPAKSGTVIMVIAALDHDDGGGDMQLWKRVNGFTDHWEDMENTAFGVGVNSKKTETHGPGVEFRFSLVGATDPHITLMVTGV